GPRTSLNSEASPAVRFRCLADREPVQMAHAIAPGSCVRAATRGAFLYLPHRAYGFLAAGGSVNCHQWSGTRRTVEVEEAPVMVSTAISPSSMKTRVPPERARRNSGFQNSTFSDLGNV